MGTPYKVIYFCDAIFLGGAEEYLKLLVPEISQGHFQTRVALSQSKEISSLANFFECQGIPVDYIDCYSKSSFKNFIEAYCYFQKHQPTIRNPLVCQLPSAR